MPELALFQRRCDRAKTLYGKVWRSVADDHDNDARDYTSTHLRTLFGTPFIDEKLLLHFFGSGLVVSIPKKKWESITGDDLEKVCGHAIRKGDVLTTTGWHKEYEDDYFPYCPGLVQSAADWMVEKGRRLSAMTPSHDHPLATALVHR